MKKKLHILAVDDEPIVAESIATVLEAPHRKIVVAKDGREALAKAAKEKFDVIITDHRMPRKHLLGKQEVGNQTILAELTAKVLDVNAARTQDEFIAWKQHR